MNKPLLNALLIDFPRLYQQLKYFECREGWASLLRQLSEELELRFQALPETMKQEIAKPDYSGPKYQAVQVKQKFGGLRFYMDATTEPMNQIINYYERLSFETCEDCGTSLGARARNDSVWSTLCAACLEARATQRTA